MLSDLEPEDKLYIKHTFTSGEEAAHSSYAKYATPKQIEEYLIRGWRCTICGHTPTECRRRNTQRPQIMGTYRCLPSR